LLKHTFFPGIGPPERVSDSFGEMELETPAFLRRIFVNHLKPRAGLLAASLSSMVFAAASTGALPFLIQIAADRVFVGQDRFMLYALPAAVIVVIAFKALAEYVSTVSEAFIGHRVVADLRIQMFEALAHADLAWLQRTHSGRFSSSFLHDVALIRTAAAGTIVGLGQNFLKVLALLGAMFWMDWRLASLAILVLPAGFIMLGRQRRRMRSSVNRSLQQTGDLGQLISQTLTGIRIVKAYRRENQEADKARSAINRAFDYVMDSVRTRAMSGPFTEFLTGIGFAAAIFYGGWQGLRGALTPGEFMGFMTAAMLVYQPLKALASLQTSLQEGVSAGARVFSIIDRVRSVVERPGARDLEVTRGQITFENVTFAYESGGNVLERFSLTVPAGAKVALVGPSGAGKSTVLNLVLRFYDPIQGRILMDGQDIAEATLSSVRQASALLTQDPVLFDDTVRANIMYGSEDVDPAAVEAAAKAAAAHDFIMRLPRGYDTQVGEAGGLLSGGERQRIAIARAILRGAPILLLDEPTSALDSEAEAHVQAALDRLFKGRTVLMIAHRLSTVKQADLIVVMERGRVVELGRHEELLARKARYAQFYRTQFAEAVRERPAAIVGE